MELNNDPVIDALEYYAVENNTTDFFYMDESHSIESYESMAFDEVKLGPLTFKTFEGTNVNGITHFNRKGDSQYKISLSQNSDPAITLTTNYNHPIWDNNLSELATYYAYQLDAEGYSVEITKERMIMITNTFRFMEHTTILLTKIRYYYILFDLGFNYQGRTILAECQIQRFYGTNILLNLSGCTKYSVSLDFNDSGNNPKTVWMILIRVVIALVQRMTKKQSIMTVSQSHLRFLLFRKYWVVQFRMVW